MEGLQSEDVKIYPFIEQGKPSPVESVALDINQGQARGKVMEIQKFVGSSYGEKSDGQFLGHKVQCGLYE